VTGDFLAEAREYSRSRVPRSTQAVDDIKA